MEIVNFVQENAFLLLVIFTALEKIIKKSPTKWNDILFDMIVDPLEKSLRESLKKKNK
jgi:hypothetical protein